MYTASNFYMTVQMSHVSLLFMRMKLIRNNNLPSEVGAEHVLEAVAERGCSQSFCRSEQRHPSLPFLTVEVSAGLTHLLAAGYDHASLYQRFPSRCAAPLFSVIIISDSPSTGQFPWSESNSSGFSVQTEP